MNAKHAPLVLAAVAVFFSASPLAAQQPMAECPAPEPGATTPIELRIAGIVLRAEVNADVGAVAGDSTRLDARLVSCEDPTRRAQEPRAEPGARPADSVLRLLNDLRLGILLAPSSDGRCFRARIEVSDHAQAVRNGRGNGPLGLELCGLPIGRTATGSPLRIM